MVVWVVIVARRRRNDETPGHAEMTQKNETAIEVNQNILGPARHPFDAPALQPGDKIRWKRKSQVGPAQLYPDQNAPF